MHFTGEYTLRNSLIVLGTKSVCIDFFRKLTDIEKKHIVSSLAYWLCSLLKIDIKGLIKTKGKTKVIGLSSTRPVAQVRFPVGAQIQQS